MTTQLNPANAVREALEHFADNCLTERDSEAWTTIHAHIASLEDRLAAIAGAAPVAWDFQTCDEPRWPGDSMRQAIYDASEAARLRYKGYDMRPLFTHAPAKAREVTDADVERALKAWREAYAPTKPGFTFGRDAMRAALSTFAEGD